MSLLIILMLFSFAQCIQYNETESIELAAYSLSSYCLKDSLSPYNCGIICGRSGDLSDVSFMADETYKIFGYIGYQEQNNQILVVFRGSVLSEFKNIVIDLKINMLIYEFCEDCRVCNGYYSSFLKLKSQANTQF